MAAAEAAAVAAVAAALAASPAAASVPDSHANHADPALTVSMIDRQSCCLRPDHADHAD